MAATNTAARSTSIRHIFGDRSPAELFTRRYPHASINRCDVELETTSSQVIGFAAVECRQH